MLAIFHLLQVYHFNIYNDLAYQILFFTIYTAMRPRLETEQLMRILLCIKRMDQSWSLKWDELPIKFSVDH